MPLPLPLLRLNPRKHKNDFGHVLILAGSPSMLGAAALCGLSAMRSGAGLTTIGIAKSLNLSLQKKISSVIMTFPLPQTVEGTLSNKAFPKIMTQLKNFQVLALGPGLSRNEKTKKLILNLLEQCSLPIVIDADALHAVADNLSSLQKNSSPRILTPHPGEMERLTGIPKNVIEKSRKKIAQDFARKHQCTLVLKGSQSIIASAKGEIFVNSTGNVGMATAGSGDVLTGMIAAFVAQGIESFKAAKLAVYLHGKAGDRAAKEKSKASLIATDIIDNISKTLRYESK